MARTSVVWPWDHAALPLRRGAITALAASVFLAFLSGCLFVTFDAWEARRQILEEGVRDAEALSDDVDREVQAAQQLLSSLATSPALQTGELRTFYEQMLKVPKPSGSWIVLWDMKKQLLNSTQPFGAALPLVSDFKRGQEQWDRLRESAAGLLVGWRTFAPLLRTDVLPVHARVDAPDGRMIGALTASISTDQIDLVVRRQRLRDGWRGTIVDRIGQPLTGGSHNDQDALDFQRAVLKANAGQQGHFTSWHHERPLVVVYFGSSATGLVTLTTAPVATLVAPVRRAVLQVTLAGAALMLAALLAYVVMSREVAIPLARMSAKIDEGQSELQATNARLRAVLAGVSDCYVTLDHDLLIVDASQAAQDWFGFDLAKVAGSSFWTLVPYAEEASRLLRKSIREFRPLHVELPSTMRPGRWLDFRFYPAPESVGIFFRDVTERRLAEMRIRQIKRLLRTSLDALSSPIVIVAERGDIAYRNRAWSALSGQSPWRADEPAGATSFATLIARIAGTEGQRVAATVQAVEDSGEPGHLSFAHAGRSYQVSASTFVVDGSRSVVVAFEDVTDMAQARDEVQQLSNSLLTLQESERRRIAQELHDFTAQHLVAASLGVMRLRPHAPSLAARDICGEIDNSLEQALKEVRSFSYLLHPPHLEIDGLENSIRSFADGFSHRSGLIVTLRLEDGLDALAFEAQRTVFRVVQEALMNVHRHAEATRVLILMRIRADCLRIRVHDNGRGMAPVAELGQAGVGIPGMASRLGRLGGSLAIRSGRQGTTLLASLPLSAAEGRPDGLSGFARSEIRVSLDFRDRPSLYAGG